MSEGLTLVLLMVGFGISWYTAHSVGRFWTESKVIGGGLRVVVVGSVVLAALGFTGVYLMLLFVLVMMMGRISPDVVQTVFPLSYGVVGAPGIAALPSLWLNGQVAARRASLLGGAGAPAFNLPFSPLDTLDMALRAPSLLDSLDGALSGLFEGRGGRSGGSSGGDGGGDGDFIKALAILLLIALAVFALCAGIFTTILIVQHADQEHVAEIYDLYQP